MKERRRELRHNMTKAEAMLWSRIKKKQISGQRFLRQFSIGSYVVDFHCQQLNMAIEVDGTTHDTKAEIEYDNQRQEAIENLQIIFLRFKNDEVFADVDSVVAKIKERVDALLKNPPAPLSQRGEKKF
jgi:very-short-patch-repair endonuclease